MPELGPHIDWTVSAGNLIPVFIAIFALYVALTNRIKALETKVEPIWLWLTRQLPDVAGRAPTPLAPNVYLHGRRNHDREDLS